MAEECRYYYYESGYCCALKRQKEGNSSIDSDTVHRYCWGYHYEDCPRYKSAHSSGGCYLTSACAEAKGLGDNCSELLILREFRDNYLRNTEDGDKEIAEYYITAPLIVKKIKEQSNSKAIFDRIFAELVEPCVLLIKTGNLAQAHQIYKNYTLKLKEEYKI